MKYRITLWTTDRGHHIEQNIFGYETEADAWEDFEHYKKWFESSLAKKADGSVYQMTDAEVKRLSCQ